MGTARRLPVEKVIIIFEGKPRILKERRANKNTKLPLELILICYFTLATSIIKSVYGLPLNHDHSMAVPALNTLIFFYCDRIAAWLCVFTLLLEIETRWDQNSICNVTFVVIISTWFDKRRLLYWLTFCDFSNLLCSFWLLLMNTMFPKTSFLIWPAFTKLSIWTSYSLLLLAYQAPSCCNCQALRPLDCWFIECHNVHDAITRSMDWRVINQGLSSLGHSETFYCQLVRERDCALLADCEFMV